MRLRTTLVVLLAVIGIALSGVVYAGFAFQKDSIIAEEQRTVETTAATVATDIDTRLDEKAKTVALWAGNVHVQRHGTDEQSAALRTFVDRTGFQGATVVNRSGRVVAVSIPDTSRQRQRALLGENLSDRRYVQVALAGTVYVSDPIEAESGNYIVTISSPIRVDGRIVGTLNGAFHLTEPDFFSQSTSLLEDRQFLSVTTSEAEPGTLYEEAPPDGRLLVANATVDRTGWTVTVSQSRALIQQRLWRVTLTQAAGVLLVLFSVGLVGLWVSRTTLRQLDRLIEALATVESGEYDTTLAFDRIDEWERIAQQFNDLTTTLHQRDSQLRVFNRVLRHNLRNDMTVVLTHADGILAAEDVPEQVRDAVERIRRTAEKLMNTSEHARTVHEELLAHGERERTPVAVDSVVEAVAATLRQEYPRSSITTDVPDDARVLDTDHLSVVVSELAYNALEHNDLPPAERELTVRAEHSGDEIHLAISDNGPGLPDLERELLIGEREETPTEHGSGLGVWLANWLVEQLGGTIAVETGERGTTVTVTLPSAEENE